MRCNTQDMPNLGHYRYAETGYENTTPWKTDPDGPRPLAARTQKWATLRREGDAIVAKMYDTDIVTYWPDGTMRLRLYPTVSTQAVVNELLRWTHTSVHCMTSLDHGLLQIDQHIYTLRGSTVTLQMPFGPWAFDERPTLVDAARDTVPFQVKQLDRTVARRAAKDSGLNTFLTWRKAYRAISTEEVRGVTWTPLLSMLADPTQWPALAWCNVEHLRQALYRATPGAIVTTEQGTVTPSMLRTLLRREKTY